MYDPTYWYDRELNRDAIAQEYGYEDLEDYFDSGDTNEELEAKLEL